MGRATSRHGYCSRETARSREVQSFTACTHLKIGGEELKDFCRLFGNALLRKEVAAPRGRARVLKQGVQLLRKVRVCEILARTRIRDMCERRKSEIFLGGKNPRAKKSDIGTNRSQIVRQRSITSKQHSPRVHALDTHTDTA